ncbi:MAG: type VI secretion protein IcmF/TssM N-terminal domain-containing protein, partial [Terriglobia bacterium]
MSSSMLTHLLPMVPDILTIVILLILCLAALLVITLHKARKKTGPETIASAGRVEGKKWVPAPLAGLAPSSDLRVSFARALKFMRANIAGRDCRYQVPWFMLVGETGSGKTTLLNASDLSSSGARHNFKVERSIQWRFFDQGIILDVPGEYFLRAESSTADEGKWQQLLRLLQKHRPRRPIDGMVLTLSCADLLQQQQSGLAPLGEKAAFIYEKLWRAQKTLGLCFPVYVMVTQCDLISGFKDFCGQLPRSRHRDIFGWSSPYHLDAAFTPRWIDEAFESLSKSLHGLQSETLLEMRDVCDRDEAFLFPSRFQALRAPLKFFLDALFKQTAYRESFRLRGLYFCGDGKTESSDVILALPETELQLESDPESELGLLAFHPAAPSATLPKAPIFLTQLFEEKIFPESGLARPFSSAFISRNRTVVASQVLSLSLAVILG